MKARRITDGLLTRRRILRCALRGGFGSALWAGLLLNGCGRKKAVKRPNIVFILIDALRADRLGCYGNNDNLSPALDAIAGEGLVFERAIAQAPWTQPSMASLFCSRYPGVHGVTDYNDAFEAAHRGQPTVTKLSGAFVTLAEALQQSGYATAAFVANPFVVRDFGFAQGFEHFDSSFADNTTTGDVVNKAVLTWLAKRDTHKPFFCFLHYMDVHGPYNAGPEFLDSLLDRVEALPDKTKLTAEEFQRLGYLRQLPPVYTNRARHDRLNKCRQYWAARYDAGVRQVDYHIAELKKELAKMGLWDGLYVITTADHGESLDEHGYWDHGYTLFHPELHVPLLLRWPDVFTAGRRIADMVRLIDVMPTLIDELGLRQTGQPQGRSLVSLIRGRSSEQVPAFAEAVKNGPEQKAVYMGDWKLILKKADPLPRLYNLAADPLEANDLSTTDRDKASQLTNMLQRQNRINTRLASEISIETVPLSAEQQKRLRSLGYLR